MNLLETTVERNLNRRPGLLFFFYKQPANVSVRIAVDRGNDTSRGTSLETEDFSYTDESSNDSPLFPVSGEVFHWWISAVNKLNVRSGATRKPETSVRVSTAPPFGKRGKFLPRRERHPQSGVKRRCILVESVVDASVGEPGGSCRVHGRGSIPDSLR